MKLPPLLRAAIIFAICALGGIGWWLVERSAGPAPDLAVSTDSARITPSLSHAGSPFRVSSPPVGGAQIPPAPEPASVEFAAAFNGFSRWVGQYLSAPPVEQPALLEEGIRLARARRAFMANLIERDPREALARAVPMAARQSLPAEVDALLERRVSEKAFFGVLGVLGAANQAIQRSVQLADGTTLEAFVYGRRSRQSTTPVAYVSGVAIDQKIAVDERPLRVLEAGERPRAAKIVTTCPISGKTTPVDVSGGALPPITSETPAVEIAGTIHYLCSGGHVAAVEEQLRQEEGGVAQEGSTGGAQKPTGAPFTYNSGPRSHLYMRVTFADQLTDPQAEKDCYDMMRQVNDFMIENSYGKCYFVTTVTPLLVLPRTEGWYNINASGFANEVLQDARVAAKAAGYDWSAYDFDTVRYNGPGNFGGQAYVGGRGCWLKSNSVGVACHEYGHNLGLWHANFWNTTPVSAIGPGVNLEYGNIFDTMGSASAGANHYGAFNKSVLNWMSPELITTVRQSGTYRIFAHDQVIADPSRRYGLHVSKDYDRDYWCEFRQKFTTNTWMMSGLQVTWDAWGTGGAATANGSNAGPQLLDLTPGSPDGRTDAQLVIGRTFSDLEAGVHITPVGKGGTVPESLDVVVNVGPFPTNQPPVVTLSASATTAALAQNLTFTATASDPDGDTLAYAWDYGDKTFAITNAPVVTKSWATAGRYTVRCTVSDMKGKVATQFVAVTVGSPTATTLSGQVLGPGAQPLEGVLVHNGLTAAAFRGAYTDSAGNYTVSNIDPGTYTMTALLPGYTFTTQAVTVSGPVTGINFTAANVPSLTIQATDPSARENSADTGTFRITRTGPVTAAQIVRVTFPGGTATKGPDYTLLPDPTYNSTSGAYELTIPANSATLDVVLTTVNDATAEGPEIAILQLVPMATLNIVGSNQATVVIDDDDTALPRVKIIANDEFADESGDPGQFTVSRTGSTAGALTVSYAVSGTATNGVDYTSLSGSLVIPAGSASTLINLLPISDGLVEGTEIATLTISTNAAYVRDTVLSASVTISDRDVNVLTVTATDNAAAEAGDLGTFTITRTGDLSSPLVVDYAMTGVALHGTDYLRLVGTSTIPAGQASTTVTVVPINDNIGEVAQTATLQLRSRTTYLVGTPAVATITISDNDLPTFSIGAVDGYSVEPASGVATDTGLLRIYRAGTSATPTVVYYTVTGTATSGVDYTALSGSVTFATTDTQKDLIITPLLDAEFENTELVTVTLTPDPAYLVEPESSASVQIIDNGQPTVGVSTEAVTPTESSASVRFWISRLTTTASALSVQYTLSGTATIGSDYTDSSATPGTAVIPANAAGVYVTLPIINDTVPEGAESITLDITPQLGTYSVRAASATYWVADNDVTGLPQVSFPATTGTGAESVGVVQIPVTLSTAAATPVTVQYVMNGGSATAGGVDYVSLSGTLTFAPGETSKNISLSIVDDNLPESSETVSLALVNPTGAVLGASTYTYTIVDDDSTSLVVGFAGTTSSAFESVTAPQTIMVSLSAVSATTVTVSYSTNGGTAASPADYTLNSGTLTFAPGEVAKPIPISVVNDSVVESGGETVVVKLTSATGATLGANAQHTFTILDDPLFTIAATVSAAAEGGANGSFTVTRAGTTNVAVTATLALSGTATNGADYQAIGSTLAFAANQTTLVIPVSVINDLLIEGSETVIATLSPGAGYKVGSASSATVNIADDDRNVAPSFVKGANIIVNEDAGVQTRGGWATGINPGSANEASQTLTFTATADAPMLFVQGPAIAADGTLFFTPAPDANGSATVSVFLKDDGGTVNGGSDTSATQTFTITLQAVNDAPSFTKGANVTTTGGGPQTFVGWATNLSAGPANESAQTLTFLVAATDPSLFSAAPAITSDGTLRFTPTALASGTTTVSVQLRDDGGTGNGGVDLSAAQTFTITLTVVNQPPTLDVLAPLTLSEDAGPQTVNLTGIGTGAANEDQTLVVTAVSDNPALIANPTVTYVSPQSTGTLALRLEPNASGVANIRVTVNDGGTENATFERAFRVTVGAVNDAPVFTKGADMSVLEDAGPQTIAGWATGISAGPEETQQLDFVVSSDNAALFAAAPAISPQGVLTFTSAPNENGTATIKVHLHDDGGTADGGIDASAEQTFTITVAPVNDAPTFTKGAGFMLPLNAGAQTAVQWATQISAGPADENGQTLDFVVTNDLPALFSAAPALDANGTLTFTMAAGASGSATVTVRLHDSGGTADGGADLSAAQSFTIRAVFVNKAPSFTAGAAPSVGQDSGAQTVTAWATNISPGPAEEAGQQMHFEVTVDDVEEARLFTTAPAVSPTGTLTFTPAPSASGTAKVTVRLHDDGGTNDGGVDTSAAQTFEITITTYLEEAGAYHGLVQAADGVALDAEHFGQAQITVTPKGAFTGRLQVGPRWFVLTGSFDKAGAATFGRLKTPTRPLHRAGLPDLTLALQLDVGGSSDQLTGTLAENGQPFATVKTDRALFTAKRNAAPPLRPLPPDLAGSYRVLFAARTLAASDPAAALSPRGHGFGTVTVTASGSARLTGTLADGTVVSCANALSKNKTWPLFVPIARGQGSLSGWVSFDEPTAANDLTGSGFHWFKPATTNRRVLRYPAGWPSGIETDLLGSKFVAPPRTDTHSALPSLTPVDTNGNAAMAMHGGGLSADLNVRLNIAPNDSAVPLTPNTNRCTVRIVHTTGGLSGSFYPPGANRPAVFRGVILQKQQMAGGFFLSPTSSGSVELVPQDH